MVLTFDNYGCLLNSSLKKGEYKLFLFPEFGSPSLTSGCQEGAVFCKVHRLNGG